MGQHGAFHNDAKIKLLALADAEKGSNRGWATDATEAERLECAQKYGLSVGFVTLLSMSSRAPYLEGSAIFLRDTLSQIEPGTDTDAILYDWFKRVWSNPKQDVSSHLSEGAVASAAMAIIDLLDVSRDREIPKREWRAARNSLLACAKEVGAEAASYARVVVAMAWDMKTMPGVASDVWLAWERAHEDTLGLAAGWPKDRQDEVTEHYRAAMRKAQLGLSRFDETATVEERQAYEVALKEASDRELDDAGHRQEFEGLMAYWQSGIVDQFHAWRADALDTIKSAAQAVGQKTA